MLLLFETGVTAYFMVYQTVKIWQTATLHHIPWSVKKVFELSERSGLFLKSSLLNNHVWRQRWFLFSSWKLISPNETDSLTAWHAACGLRWSQIVALQPLIYRVGTLHHATCATPVAAEAASAGAFQNGRHLFSPAVRSQHSPNHHGLHIIFLLWRPWWLKQQFTVFMGGFISSNKVLILELLSKCFTSDEQLKSKLHLTRHVIKSVLPEIIASSFCLNQSFLFLKDATKKWQQRSNS